MSWNYRVIRTNYITDPSTFGIHEVYYDEKGMIKSWTEKAVQIGDLESLEELVDALNLMLEAVETKKVLEEVPIGKLVEIEI